MNDYISESHAEKVWEDQISLDALTYGASPPSMTENLVNCRETEDFTASHFIDRTAVFNDGCLRRSDLHGLEFPLSQRYFSPCSEFDLTDLIQFRQA